MLLDVWNAFRELAPLDSLQERPDFCVPVEAVLEEVDTLVDIGCVELTIGFRDAEHDVELRLVDVLGGSLVDLKLLDEG
jgi:hypothetical protein